jgi:hypothetical protein
MDRTCTYVHEAVWILSLPTDNFRMNTGMVDTVPLIIWLV